MTTTRATLPQHPPNLAQALRQGRDNNLDLIRLTAALCVAVSHAWPLALGPGTAEPLEDLTGRSLGGWAVLAFFFLSGLLVGRSAATRPARAFWQARARRLLPALGLALLVTLALALICGAEGGPGALAAYVLRGLTLVSIAHALPGAWPANPIPAIANGPVWSLFHEAAAYTLCFAATRLRLMTRRFGPGLLGLSALALWAGAESLPPRLATFAPLWLAFVCGMLGWHFAFRIRLRVDGAAALALLALLSGGALPLAILALGQGLLCLAFRTRPLPLPADLSYGVYLYAWPVAQTLLAVFGPLPPPSLAGWTIAACLPFAALSWWLAERPGATGLRRAAD